MTAPDDPDMVDMIRLASYLAQDAAEARKGKGRRVSLTPAQAERAADILLAYVNRKVEDHAASLGI
jgi:hypothetical protein